MQGAQQKADGLLLSRRAVQSMGRRKPGPTYREYRFRKRIHAPLPFVFRWCTDYREDDPRLTNSLYHYRARIVLREPTRIVRIITVAGKDRNRCTDVEIISLRPPNRWRLLKFSATDDETGSYRLTRRSRGVTALEMHFRKKWKIARLPNQARYRELFNRVWDRYVTVMEREYRQSSKRSDHKIF